MYKGKSPLGVILEGSIQCQAQTVTNSIPQNYHVYTENFDFFSKKLALVNLYQYMRKPSRREPRGSNLKLNRISRQTYA